MSKTKGPTVTSKVKPATRAKACAAVAEWEAKKAKSKVKSAAKKLKEATIETDEVMTEAEQRDMIVVLQRRFDVVESLLRPLNRSGARKGTLDAAIELLETPEATTASFSLTGRRVTRTETEDARRGLSHERNELMHLLEALGADSKVPENPTDEVDDVMDRVKKVSQRDPRAVKGQLNLKRGDEGSNVQSAQSRLGNLGYEVKADGDYGPKTEQTVKSFQGDHDLKIDGKLGRQTRTAMRGTTPDDITERRVDAEKAKEADSAPESAPDKAPEQSKPFDWLTKGRGIGEDPDPKVETMQRGLESMGTYVGDKGADGRFGPETEAGVKRVQRRFGLKPDGLVGPKTSSMLDRNAGDAMKDPDKDGDDETSPDTDTDTAEDKKAPEIEEAAKGRHDESKHPRGKKGTPEGGRFVKSGSSGAEVSGLQDELGMKKTDGEFGKSTVKAVKEYQRENELQVDGIVGSQTAASLQGREASVGSLSKSDMRYLRKQGKGLEEASVRGAIRGLRDILKIKRLPDGTFAPQGRGRVLTPGQDVSVPRRRGDSGPDVRGKVELDGKVKLIDGPDAGQKIDIRTMPNAPTGPDPMQVKRQKSDAGWPVGFADPPDGQASPSDAKARMAVLFDTKPGDKISGADGETLTVHADDAGRYHLRDSTGKRVDGPDMPRRLGSDPKVVSDGQASPPRPISAKRFAPGEANGLTPSERRDRDQKKLEAQNRADFKREVAERAKGQSSPATDKQIEQDAKAAVGRGQRSPATDAEIEKDAKRALGKSVSGQASPGKSVDDLEDADLAHSLAGGWMTPEMVPEDRRKGVIKHLQKNAARQPGEGAVKRWAKALGELDKLDRESGGSGAQYSPGTLKLDDGDSELMGDVLGDWAGEDGFLKLLDGDASVISPMSMVDMADRLENSTYFDAAQDERAQKIGGRLRDAATTMPYDARYPSARLDREGNTSLDSGEGDFLAQKLLDGEIRPEELDAEQRSNAKVGLDARDDGPSRKMFQTVDRLDKGQASPASEMHGMTDNALKLLIDSTPDANQRREAQRELDMRSGGMRGTDFPEDADTMLAQMEQDGQASPAPRSRGVSKKSNFTLEQLAKHAVGENMRRAAQLELDKRNERGIGPGLPPKKAKDLSVGDRFTLKGDSDPFVVRDVGVNSGLISAENGSSGLIDLKGDEKIMPLPKEQASPGYKRGEKLLWSPYTEETIYGMKGGTRIKTSRDERFEIPSGLNDEPQEPVKIGGEDHIEVLGIDNNGNYTGDDAMLPTKTTVQIGQPESVIKAAQGGQASPATDAEIEKDAKLALGRSLRTDGQASPGRLGLIDSEVDTLQAVGADPEAIKRLSDGGPDGLTSKQRTTMVDKLKAALDDGRLAEMGPNYTDRAQTTLAKLGGGDATVKLNDREVATVSKLVPGGGVEGALADGKNGVDALTRKQKSILNTRLRGAVGDDTLSDGERTDVEGVLGKLNKVQNTPADVVGDLGVSEIARGAEVAGMPEVAAKLNRGEAPTVEELKKVSDALPSDEENGTLQFSRRSLGNLIDHGDGQASPSLDSQIEQDAKAAVGRGQRSPGYNESAKGVLEKRGIDPEAVDQMRQIMSRRNPDGSPRGGASMPGFERVAMDKIPSEDHLDFFLSRPEVNAPENAKAKEAAEKLRIYAASRRGMGRTLTKKEAGSFLEKSTDKFKKAKAKEDKERTPSATRERETAMHTLFLAQREMKDGEANGFFDPSEVPDIDERRVIRNIETAKRLNVGDTYDLNGEEVTITSMSNDLQPSVVLQGEGESKRIVSAGSLADATPVTGGPQWSGTPEGAPSPQEAAEAVQTRIDADPREHIDVGDDVRRAADLLSAGERVKLDQPRTVSILLEELDKRVKAAVEAGDEAPAFNVCDISVPNTNLFCSESKGIARVHMPQLSGVPTPGSKGDAMGKNGKGEVDLSGLFREMLEGEGVSVEDTSEKAAMLRATQNELNGAKVAGIVGAMRGGVKIEGAPLFVSSDNYIVDGHHRWAANVGVDSLDGEVGGGDDEGVPMDVQRIDMSITDLLERANAFAEEYGIPQAGVGDNRHLAGQASPGQSKKQVSQAVDELPDKSDGISVYHDEDDNHLIVYRDGDRYSADAYGVGAGPNADLFPIRSDDGERVMNREELQVVLDREVDELEGQASPGVGPRWEEGREGPESEDDVQDMLQMGDPSLPEVVTDVADYDSAGILGGGRGLVVNLEDGSEYQLSIDSDANSDAETAFQERLQEILDGDPFAMDALYEDYNPQGTFEQQGLLTRNRGVEFKDDKGQRFQVTIVRSKSPDLSDGQASPPNMIARRREAFNKKRDALWDGLSEDQQNDAFDAVWSKALPGDLPPAGAERDAMVEKAAKREAYKMFNTDSAAFETDLNDYLKKQALKQTGQASPGDSFEVLSIHDPETGGEVIGPQDTVRAMTDQALEERLADQPPGPQRSMMEAEQDRRRNGGEDFAVLRDKAVRTLSRSNDPKAVEAILGKGQASPAAATTAPLSASAEEKVGSVAESLGDGWSPDTVKEAIRQLASTGVELDPEVEPAATITALLKAANFTPEQLEKALRDEFGQPELGVV